MTNEPDLDQPATVIWIPFTRPPATISGGDTRDFGTLTRALHFVRDELQSEERATALINTADGRSYSVEEVDELIGRL